MNVQETVINIGTFINSITTGYAPSGATSITSHSFCDTKIICNDNGEFRLICNTYAYMTYILEGGTTTANTGATISARMLYFNINEIMSAIENDEDATSCFHWINALTGGYIYMLDFNNFKVYNSLTIDGGTSSTKGYFKYNITQDGTCVPDTSGISSDYIPLLFRFSTLIFRVLT